ncbi:MAG TPA: DUF2892 domain-containing protein [Sedimenticola sp.]|nr:DUF2892 domain-containing protein [Sedimenticola sp.]
MSVLEKIEGYLKKCFPENVGKSERTMRMLIGMLLIGIAFLESITPDQEFWLTFLGALGLLTGVTGHCPVYGFLGRDTAD